MSRHVARMMLHGFLAERAQITRRYPIFYVIQERGGPDPHLDKKPWTPVALLYADACYILWMQSLLLEYVALAGGLGKLQQTNLNEWYRSTEFVLFASKITADYIIERFSNPGEGIEFVDNPEDGTLPMEMADIPLITADTLEWHINVPADPSVDDGSVIYNAAATYKGSGPKATFLSAQKFDTESDVASLLGRSVVTSFGTAFEKQADFMLENLGRANPAADFPAIIGHASHGHDKCRCDIFAYLFIHVAAFSAVMKAAKLNMDALKVMIDDSPALRRYERGFLMYVLLKVALLRSNFAPRVPRGMIIGGDKLDAGSSGLVDGPEGAVLLMKAHMRLAPLAEGDGSRHNLRRPHVYAYFSHGVSYAPNSGIFEPYLRMRLKFVPSSLVSAYENAAGHMVEVENSVARLELRYMPPAASRPIYLCFLVFYEIITGRNEVEPQYAAVSRGYLKMDGPITPESIHGQVVTTFAGPMSSEYSIHTEGGHVGGNKRDFKYVADCVLTLDTNMKFDSITPSRAAQSAPVSLLLRKEDEACLNQYTEHMYDAAAHLKSPQSFIFKGIPGVIAPLTVGAFLPHTDNHLLLGGFRDSLYRAIKRMGITEDSFIELMSIKDPTPWQTVRIKHLVIETLNMVNVLRYVSDRVFDVNVDIHQDVRLVNEGDCEDFAWALYLLLKGLMGPYRNAPPPLLGEGDVCLKALMGKLRRENAQPMFVSMYIDYPTSNMHSAVILQCAPENPFGNYMMEGTGPNHGDFCTYQSFGEEEKESVEWYNGVYEAVKSKNKAANDRMFTMYAPPIPASREFDAGGDEHFYRGFLGGVLDGEYVRFTEKNETSLKEMGVDICKVIHTQQFDLVKIPPPSEEPYYKTAMEEMEYVAGLAPPLPMPPKYAHLMPEYVKEAKAAFEAVFTYTLADADNTGMLMNRLPVFYNLHGRTMDEVVSAASTLKEAAGDHLAKVHAFSNFPGAWTIEIDIYRQ